MDPERRQDDLAQLTVSPSSTTSTSQPFTVSHFRVNIIFFTRPIDNVLTWDLTQQCSVVVGL